MPLRWSSLVAIAGVAWLATRASATTGTISLPLVKRIRRGHVLELAKGIHRRQADPGSLVVEDSLQDNMSWTVGGSYYISIMVGTPPQNITAVLDTGSADLYLDAASASACQSSTAANSCRGGSYSASSSSTYDIVGADQFNSRFADGSTVSGDFATDTISFGNIAIENAQFGVANSINNTSGFAISLMGVGYSYLESSQTPYPNLPELLHQGKAINSRLYSIFLDHVDSGSGTILFGGIDTSKFTGGISTLNLLPYTASGRSLVTEFIVAITNISVMADGQGTVIFESKTSTYTDAIPGLLDTGSSAWNVPINVYNGLRQAFGAAIDDENNIACSHRGDNVQIEITFGGSVTIVAPASEYIVPLYDPTTDAPVLSSDGLPLCVFMIQPDRAGQLKAQGFLTLGDSILRSMYVVYDLDNGQVSIAQSAPGATGRSIKAVPAGLDGVSVAVAGSSPVTTAPANTNSIASELQATRTIVLSTLAATTGTIIDPDNATSPGSPASTGKPAAAMHDGNATTDGVDDNSTATKSARPILSLYTTVCIWFIACVIF